MRKLITAIVLCFASANSLAGEPDKRLYEQCIYPTVLLWSKSTTAPGFSGTGVIVRSEKQENGEYHNVVFSATHCLRTVNTNPPTYAALSIQVPVYKDWSHIESWEEYPATIKRTNVKSDACVIHFKTKKQLFSATPNFSPKLYLGNEVFHVGAGGPIQYPRIDFGRITSCRFPLITQHVLRTSIYTISGDSGSPVYHEYQVVGITHAVETHGAEAYREYSYAIPMNPYFSSGDLTP